MSAINEEEAISINFSLHRLPLKILYFRFRVEFSARACLIKGSKYFYFYFFFQAEDGIRDQPRSRGLGDVYKRQTI